jgi:hypothetical protein
MTDYITNAHNDVAVYFASHEIPAYFYQCFFGELIKVWGVIPLIPDKEYLAEYDDDGNIITSNEDDYSYRDQIDYFLTIEGGTCGWGLAFKESCAQCDLMDMYEYYCSLDWVRGDYFDGCIADKMSDVLFAEGRHNDYYLFKIRKENPNV